MILLAVYSMMVLSYTVNLFLDSVMLDEVTGILALLSLILSFPKASGLYKTTGTVFMVIGFSLYLYLQRPLLELPHYMNSTVVLLVIFYVLPFINSIIIVGRYDKSVNKLLKRRVGHLGQLYYRSSLASFLLGSFLNIATIPLVESVLRRNLQKVEDRVRDLFISRAMLRGYALCLAWSPMEILVAISVDITHSDYVHLLPWLFLFSTILLFVDWLIGLRYRKFRVEQSAAAEDMPLDARTVKKVAVLLLYLSIFIAAVILAKRWLGVNFLMSVALVILPYSIIWALLIKRAKSYTSYSLREWRRRAGSQQNYIVLFLAAGFLISTLKETPFLDYLQQPFASVQHMPFYMFVMIQIIFLGLAMIGFHPLVTISILGEVIQPLLGQVNPLSFAIVLITSGLSTVMAGPYNITVSLTGSLLNQNPYRITFWNIGFAFLYSSVGTIIALLLL
ncbi:hypothetical protein LCY76_20105 [Fictibacillus sp. KIGAM418]|uniref:Uncharacterized protein n=1 Tax=Fictibacillus marinisediminis TaxID=2878389 RepID=A0A9X1XDJ0_9BACL|nr:hypothetical protein [Fictibacillus marinisediminis]MCK6258877.1 hypothetical protein [Fictibacillus marinisediminis]